VLVAKDHGTPISHETLRFLTVLLVDTNDNRPEFPVTETTNPYSFRVTENSQINLLVGMCLNELILNFTVTPCINNTQHFNFQLM